MVDHSTGEVLAHVGGRNYAEAPFDFIERGERPLGTAFFPFLYSDYTLSNKDSINQC
jgi:penicillin-binding protein 1A